MKRILWCLLTALTLFTCQKREALPALAHPRLATLAPFEDSPEAGLLLRAELSTTGTAPVLEYGFVWANGKELPLLADQFERISLSSPINPGLFEARADFGHVKGQSYNVRAFVRTADQIVYGNTVPFTSPGCLPPVVRSFSPPTAAWGDTVVIRGGRFSSLRQPLRVYFVSRAVGHSEALVISASPQQIVCRVPSSLPVATLGAKIEVSSYNQSGISSDEFLLETAKPVITDVSPLTGTFGTRITLRGSGFSAYSSMNNVTIGGHAAPVLESSRTQLVVTIPPQITLPSNQIRLEIRATNSGPITAVAPVFFGMKAPVISSLALSANGQNLDIQGENFHPEGKDNLLLVGPNEAVPAQGSTASSLSVALGNLVFPRPTATFNVSVTATGQQSVEKTLTLTYRNRWVKRGNERTGPFSTGLGDSDRPAGAFTANGRAYVVVTSTGSFGGKTRLYEYNPASYIWQQRADPPLAPGYELWPASFVINGKAYLLARYGEFWEYDVASDRWKRLAGAPTCTSSWPFRGFALNGKGYVVAPRGGCTSAECWEYDPATNEWQAKPGGPSSSYVVGAYETGSRAFVLVRANTSAALRLLEYVAATNTWLEKAEPDDMGDGVLGFWANGQLVLTNGSRTYRYDPNQDRWLTQNSGLGGSLFGASGVSFGVGNQGFLFYRHQQAIVAQGRSFTNNLHFWEFDPLL